MRFRVVFLLLLAANARGDDSVSFSGFVDLAYAWNPNRPASHENFIAGAGTSGKRANEVMLNLARVQWSRTPSEKQPVGFTLSLVAGEGTNVVHAGEPNGGDEFRHIDQVSIVYRVEPRLLLEAGIYPSHIGIESFCSKDNWNYTRSWLGELSPYYQTGVKASYAFSERWSGQLHVLNGWQLINDNNDAQAIGTQLTYSTGALTASLNTFVGREVAGDEDSLRKFADLVILYRLTPALQLGASFDVGAQDVRAADDANWRGVAGYARYAINDQHAVAVRAEHFDDPHSGITGVAQTLNEVTLTYEMRPREQLILKLETRRDHSTAAVFNNGDAHDKQQLLALVGAVVTF